MKCIILGRDPQNPKKPVYVSGFEESVTNTDSKFKNAFVFPTYELTLKVLTALNEERYLGRCWDYEVLTQW